MYGVLTIGENPEHGHEEHGLVREHGILFAEIPPVSRVAKVCLMISTHNNQPDNRPHTTHV